MSRKCFRLEHLTYSLWLEGIPGGTQRGKGMDELIEQFEKNATEVVRVSLTEYRGRKLVDVRVYYSDAEGQYRPTKKGVALSVDVYPDFKRAMLALEKILLERDLLSPEDLADVSAVDADEGNGA